MSNNTSYQVIKECDYKSKGSLIWDFYKHVIDPASKEIYLNSKFVVVALVAGQPAGAVRVISDGRYGYLVDLLVAR